LFGLSKLALGEQVPKALVKGKVFDRQVCAACFGHSIKSRAGSSRGEELLGIHEAAVSSDCAEEAVRPVTHGFTGSAIEALHFVREGGFRHQSP